MTRRWIPAALAAIILWPVGAGAQEQPQPAPRPRARTRVESGPFTYTFSGNRGRIGVVVKTDADAANDKIGARIEAVSPGGPAEKAGLKAGDIITRFNGTSLAGVAAEEDEASGPGMKLIELARALDPGDTAQVEYRRGTETRKASLVAEEVEYHGMSQMDIPGMVERSMPRIQVGPGWPGDFSVNMFMNAPWGGIELVSLNPDLGDYFGTREGVLVVRAPEDSTLSLKGGDVILAIGGRKPTSPEHAMRILRSYDVGETVTIDVQRKQHRTTVTWKVPDQESHFRMMPTPRRMREEPSALRWRVQPRFDRVPLKVRRLSIRAI
jgi:C-terminal processing protease CtpA/Prc